MVWRSIVVSEPARLSCKKQSLEICQEETARIPFEDIATIVLNHPGINLTHAVLSACAKHNIALFSTDETHQPSGVFLPYLQHTRATRLMRLQLQLGRPLIKKLWAHIIRQKIKNQANCLNLLSLPGAFSLENLMERIHSGDKENIEGQASGLYFRHLFGKEFYRDAPLWINAALNYGYAILRGAIARTLVGHGLLPSFGLFHTSEQNAFNLADDLIEPFRPVVDLHVAKRLLQNDTQSNSLNTTEKIGLISLLHYDIKMSRGCMSVLSSIEFTVESLVRSYERNDAALLELPVLIQLVQHKQREY